jgi:Na+/phosphate symporter
MNNIVIKEKRVWYVGDTNGTFLSKDSVERVTSDFSRAKRYEHIGDALRECAEYNRNRVSFQVISYWY